MLTSYGFSSLIWGVYSIDSSKIIGKISCSLDELQPVVSHTRPVHLQQTAGSPRTLIIVIIIITALWKHDFDFGFKDEFLAYRRPCCLWDPKYSKPVASFPLNTGSHLSGSVVFISWHFLQCKASKSNERGELTASYRWTGRVWEITDWSSRFQESIR